MNGQFTQKLNSAIIFLFETRVIKNVRSFQSHMTYFPPWNTKEVHAESCMGLK